MKCDKCGSPNVVSRIVIQGEKNTEELNLCPVCFQTFVKDHPEIKQGPAGRSLNEFIMGALNILNSGLKYHNEHNNPVNVPVKQCPNCATLSTRITRDGITGCSHCYIFFQEEINNYLFKHIGFNTKLIAGNSRTSKQNIEDLNSKLEVAVKTENFEMAAILRDEMKKLKNNKK